MVLVHGLTLVHNWVEVGHLLLSLLIVSSSVYQ